MARFARRVTPELRMKSPSGMKKPPRGGGFRNLHRPPQALHLVQRLDGLLKLVLGHFLLGHLGAREDMVDDLVLEDRRAQLLLHLRDFSEPNSKKGAFLARILAGLVQDRLGHLGIRHLDRWRGVPPRPAAGQGARGARPASCARRSPRSRHGHGHGDRGSRHARAGGRSGWLPPRRARAEGQISPWPSS